MNVSLPSSLRSFVDQQVSAKGYTSASEFVRELIRKARERAFAEERVEQLLLDGIESGPSEPFNADFFDQLRSRIRATRDAKNEAS